MQKTYTLLLFTFLSFYGYGQTCPSSVTRNCTGGVTTSISWVPGATGCTGLGSTIDYTDDDGNSSTLNRQGSCTAFSVIYTFSATCNDAVIFNLDLGGGVDCAFSSTGSLPVTLTSFKSEIHKSTVSLFWQTEAELDNAGFEIQRSFNGKDWETITFAASQGNTIERTQYAYIDKTPLKGMQYYRLNQVDYDGKSSFSQVITVEFQVSTIVNVYPNPAKDKLFIKVKTTGANTVSIFDNMGRKVLEMPLNETEIDISSLEAGIYFVQITNGNRIEKVRFVKE